VLLSDFSAALLIHFFLRISNAFTSSHQASSKAFLHAIIHAHHVFSLRAFTICAVIAIFIS
jgi:hypothetical protein